MRIMIFGTVHADTEEKLRLACQWTVLHGSLNPNCDLMLVDTNTLKFRSMNRAEVYSLGDNVGHLARSGKDGWGRAFCRGLEIAVNRGYDYVVHIEGDSLCRIDIARYCEKMSRDWMSAAGVPVVGTRRQEKQWLETGLMFFDSRYIHDSNLVRRYDWQNGDAKRYPRTPEWHMWQLTNNTMHIMKYHRNMRDDCGVLTVDNVVEYDWITHARPEIFEKFYQSAMGWGVTS